MNNKLAFSSLLLLALAGCGPEVAAIYDRTLYQTGTFSSNMYEDTILEETLIPSTTSAMDYAIASEDVRVGISSLESEDLAVQPGQPATDENYAQMYKLSIDLPRVRYGFESKLFDGILYCTDAVRISKSRLQIRPTGFGYILPQALNTYRYAGLFMKAAADTDAGGVKITDLIVHLSFYVSDETSGYIAHRFSVPISNLQPSDYPQFYGFYIPDDVIASEALKNAVAFSVSYNILNEAALQSPADTTAVFLYEVLLPHATWF